MIKIPYIASWKEKRDFINNPGELEINKERLIKAINEKRGDLLGSVTLDFLVRDYEDAYKKHGAFHDDYLRFGFFGKDDGYRGRFFTRLKRDFILESVNDPGMSAYLCDKVLFSSVWGKLQKRKIIDIDRSSLKDFSEAFKDAERIVIKPIDGNLAHGLRIIENDGNLKKIYKKFKKSNRQWLAEEFIDQNEALSSFNSSSVNSIRITTYRSGGSKILGASVFIGAEGEICDAKRRDGVEYRLDTDSGELLEGVDAFGRTQNAFTGEKIPSFDSAIELALSAAEIAPKGIELAEWEIAIRKDSRALLIGANASPSGTWVDFGKVEIPENDSVSSITLKDTVVAGNRMIYIFNVRGNWRHFFKYGIEFDITFDFLVEDVPLSVLNVPFVADILPFVWVADAFLSVNELDKNFFDCFDDVRKGYEKMFPSIEFKGSVDVKKLLPAENRERAGSVIMFSGGVDAYTTLLRHIDEKPDLLMIWGADIPTREYRGWAVMQKKVEEGAVNFGLEPHFVRSNNKKLLNLKMMNSLVEAETGDNWWHGFMHGILILSHAAVFCFKKKLETVYIASSFTYGDVYTCASDPTIDNFVRFCGAKVIHDGYELNRQQKLRFISDFVKQSGTPIDLHVCWEDKSGENCCNCEKCFRTMLGLIGESANLEDFGFKDPGTTEEIIGRLRNNPDIFAERAVSRYKFSQNRLREITPPDQAGENLKWFLELDLSSF